MLSNASLRVVFLAMSVFFLQKTTVAQDPQYSQFYAAPLYLNPAFAGSSDQARVGLNYRNQWPAIAANFTTISSFFDMYIEDINSGFGAIIARDQEGLLGLQSISFAVQYSYNLKVNKWLAVRPGVEVALFHRSINFSKLTFGDQFDKNTGQVVNSKSVEGLGTGGGKFFPSISGGVLLYTKNAWLSGAVHHITEPNQSLVGDTSRLPIKVSAHAGLKFYLKSGVIGSGLYARPAERSISPTLQYRHQGSFDQLDLGMYFTIEPIVLGIWYRGIPFKVINGMNNNESVVLLLGFIKRGAKDMLQIGYSYDYTISALGAESGGAHEVSIRYSWPTRNPRKPPKDKLVIPCPDF